MQNDFLIPSEILDKIEQLDQTQLAWLSGYCWAKSKSGLNSSISVVNNQHSNNKEILTTIISSSQTGNAKKISQQLLEKLLANNIKSRLISVNDYKVKHLSQEEIFLLITSTQGDGDPPEEATLFYKALYSKKPPNLSNARFAVLGLGDSSYPYFCKAGKDFDEILAKLGGTRILDRLDCDLDYEDDVQKWIQQIVEVLGNEIVDKSVNLSSVDGNINVTNKNLYDKDNPAVGTISLIQKITSDNSLKDVKHIEIDLSEQPLQYLPGDSLGVFYVNDDNLVEEILRLNNISNQEEVTLKNGNQETIYNVLKYNCDITKNNPNLVKKYAQLIKDKELLEIASDAQVLQEFVQKTPVIGIFKKNKLPINAEQLYSLFNKLQPRMYSISSSLAEVENEAHITVKVIEYEYNKVKYTGGASGYLGRRLQEGDKIKIFIEENNHFRLPDDKNSSIIMIAAGTGIAPYRAFMQEMQTNNYQGKNWLFFGNQKFIDDFLYQIEWIRYKKDGLLTKYNFAWSRQGQKKEYVQDKILEEGNHLWQWILDGAYIYVCGDATSMAKSVHNALIKVIKKYGNMQEEKACEFIDNLYASKRYQRDVY